MNSKINSLLKNWPRGTVAVQAWLREQGVSRQLAARYCVTRWLVRIGAGAYVQASDKVDWTGALFALQKQLGLPVHLGARTSLEMRGLAHFIPLGARRTVFLFGPPGQKLPSWFSRYPWEVNVRFLTTNLFPGDQASRPGLTDFDLRTYTVTGSSPERAMMEVLYEISQGETLEQARSLMAGLATLRSSLVQELLQNCRSIKVKRLFLVLAEEAGHKWFDKLDSEAIDLGSGKRVIGKGGRFVSKYQLSIPESGDST